MDIYSFKKQFEAALTPADPCRSAGQAWEVFKQSFARDLDGEDCEEFGFSISVATGFDGIRAYRHENLFMLYFGRLIDAIRGQPWQTVEINIYYQYEMTPALQLLLEEYPGCEIEGAFCKSDGEKKIAQKMAVFLGYVAEKPKIWDILRPLAPAKVDIQIWLQ